jgi:hypothetical protein
MQPLQWEVAENVAAFDYVLRFMDLLRSLTFAAVWYDEKTGKDLVFEAF